MYREKLRLDAATSNVILRNVKVSDANQAHQLRTNCATHLTTGIYRLKLAPNLYAPERFTQYTINPYSRRIDQTGLLWFTVGAKAYTLPSGKISRTENRTTKCLSERERENFNLAVFALAFLSRRQDPELPGAISRGLLDCPCRV